MTKIDYEAARSGKRKVTTCGGYPVRLVSNEGVEPFVLVGYLTIRGDEYGPYEWKADGGFLLSGNPSDKDLIQEPEVIEFKRWVNVSPHYVEGLFDDFRSAAWSASASCLANVLVTIRIVGDKVEIFGGTEERKDDE